MKKAVALLFFASIMAMGMEKPAQTQASIAALAIAHHLNPSESVQESLDAFNSSLMVDEALAPLIAHSLAQSNQGVLRNILKSQVPITIAIERFKKHPHNLSSIRPNGLCVRTKTHFSRYMDGDRLYKGIAQLIPDPLTNGSPRNFFQVFANPNGSTYFDDLDGNIYRNTTGTALCLWDKISGKCINNGSSIRKKIQECFPAEAAKDPRFPELFLYGLSADDTIAWAGFVYRGGHDGFCAFNIHTNAILEASKQKEISHISYSGKLCSFDTDIVSTCNPAKKYIAGLSTDLFTIEIGPKDNYVICKKKSDMHEHAQVLNMQTGKMHQLSIEDKPVMVRRDPVSSDGSLIALLKEGAIFIHNVLTNQTVAKIPVAHYTADAPEFLLFSPDDKQVVLLITDGHLHHDDNDRTSYHARTYDIATQQCVQEFTPDELAKGPFKADFMLCNEGDYLLLPNGQLLIEPQGLARHLSTKELLGLLILEQQKTNRQPLNPLVIQHLQQSKSPKIQELIARRYGPAFKRPNASFLSATSKRVATEDDRKK